MSLKRSQAGGGDRHRVSASVVTGVCLVGTGSHGHTGVQWGPQMRLSSTVGEGRQVRGLPEEGEG